MKENNNISVNNRENINQENTNNYNISPSKNNSLVIGLIIIIIILIASLVYVLFFYNNSEKENIKSNETSKTVEDNTKISSDESINVGDNYLYVYVSKDSLYSQIFGTYTDDATKIGIKVNSPNAKFISSDYDPTGNFFLYDDNGIKLYDINNKKSVSIDIDRDKKQYYINMSEDKNSVVGISYIDNNNLATYYNLKTNKAMYMNKYKVSEECYHFKNINDKYLSLETENVSYWLSGETEKVIMSYNNSKEDYFKHSYNSYGENGKYIYSLELCYDDGCTIKKLYNDQMQEFYSDQINSENKFVVYKNMVYIGEENIIKKYNMSGDLLKTNEKYGEVKQIINNYVVYVKDNKLILENIDDNDESIIITHDVESINYDSYTSGYYSRKILDGMGEKNKKEGIYVVYYYGYDSNGNGIKDSKGNYGMEYCYTSDKQVVEYPIKQEMGGRAKPVLYLYPEKETNVTVTFAHPEYLTTTYPKYNKSWEVTAKPNGDLTDKDGKYYYALYWDETRYSETNFSEGFYVESRDAIKFLEEKLTIIGLNDKERNEFIMYWLPIMEKNGKNLVYFELTKEREKDNKLIITPTPDSLLRVSIHIKKVDKKINIKEQKLETFKRTGFVAIEWGGMTY